MFYDENTQYDAGINILVGGNSLGRGVTFPQLQTIYYCRVAKSPQADTMWQHTRMFGYDRDPGLLRVFMPPKLFMLFSDINKTNSSSSIKQIENSRNGCDIKIFYPTGLKPTRKNVLKPNTHFRPSCQKSRFLYLESRINFCKSVERHMPYMI